MALGDDFPIKRPPPDLDPYLDAAGLCFVRYGWKRTTIPDIAEELHVSRTTVYRYLGTIQQVRNMYGSRMLHDIFQATIRELQQTPTPGWDDLPERIVNAVAVFVEELYAHPLVQKLARDEPEILGTFQLKVAEEFYAALIKQVAPIIKLAMDQGYLANRHPEMATDWLCRVASSVILAPPEQGVRTFLSAMFLPVFRPEATA